MPRSCSRIAGGVLVIATVGSAAAQINTLNELEAALLDCWELPVTMEGDDRLLPLLGRDADFDLQDAELCHGATLYANLGGGETAR